ncbi:MULTISPECIES: aldehyde dehydrogenase family protein [Rhizobium]|uniref:aldehyde dehydrogenase family protein n=1 Tax=Rhizobium TaxID=379 RepID=UPI00385746A5
MDRAGGGKVTKVCFTKSVATASSIASVVAARMGRLTFEIGGKSAAILLPDADIAKALPTLEQFTMRFSGQFCFSQTCLVVPRSREEEMVGACPSRVSSFRMVDPWYLEVHVGPVPNRVQFDKAMGYIAQCVEDGAKVTVQTYDDSDEAVAIAYDTGFGLSGSVFGDVDRALDVARRIPTGQMHLPWSWPRVRRLAASRCRASVEKADPLEAFLLNTKRSPPRRADESIALRTRTLKRPRDRRPATLGPEIVEPRQPSKLGRWREAQPTLGRLPWTMLGFGL